MQDVPPWWRQRTVRRALINLRTQIRSVFFDDAGIERPIELQSRLAGEIASCTHDTSRHFLGQVSQHATMLAVGIADAVGALSRLDGGVPFSGTVLTRGLLECAAHIYWLSDRNIDGTERARRAVTVFLRQTETQVRELEQYRKRVRHDAATQAQLDAGIAEGWESMRLHAQDMALAGFDVRTTKKPGAKYVIGREKPSISALVDKLISDHIGTTTLNVYGMYSSVAHAEGEGLGTLLMSDEVVQTPDGVRHRYGFDREAWKEKVVRIAARGGSGAVLAWVDLAYPSRSLDVRRALLKVARRITLSPQLALWG